MRRVLNLAVACTVALTATIGAAVSAVAAPVVTPSVSVTPSVGLSNGQTVTVNGAGLTPGDKVWIVEDCQSYCQKRLGAPGIVDAAGRISVSVAVDRFLWDSLFGVASDPPVDCAYLTSCRIRLAHADTAQEEGFAFIANQQISFVRSLPATPTVTVGVAQPLPAIVTTTVRGHGYPPGETVYVAQCFTGPTPQGYSDRCRRQTSGPADAAGDVTLSVELRRFTPDTDCADPGTVCAIRMWGGGYATSLAVTVPIRFDPGAVRPPPPTITVTPTTGLGVADTVRIQGHAFRPNRPVSLNQCSSQFLSYRCALDAAFEGNGVTVQSGPDGTFDTTFRVLRYMTQGLEPTFDCAASGTCGITAEDESFNPSEPVPLTFLSTSHDPKISLQGVFVVEGTGADGATTTALAHARLDHPSTVPVRFRLFPTSYTDTISNIDLIEIPAGQTEVTIPIAVRADNMHEPVEIVGFKFMALDGAQIDPNASTAQIVIIDDDPEPTITIENALVAENDPSGQVNVRVHLSNPTQFPVTVRYRTDSGTAHVRRDFETTRGTAHLGGGSGDGANDWYVHVPIVNDERPEPVEYFDVRLRHSTNARIAHHRGRVWIGDDDPA